MKKAIIALGILAGAVALVACAHQAPLSPERAAYRVMSEGNPEGLQKIHRTLGLSGEQQEQLRAIAKQAHSRPDAGKLEAFKNLFLADPLDQAKLREAIQTHLAEREANMQGHLAGLASMRQVLTEAQRTKLADLLQKSDRPMKHLEGMHRMVMDRLGADLKLSPEQRSALEGIGQKFQSQPKQARHAAFADFVRNGDLAKLEATMKEIHRDLPLDEVVDFASSLSLDQRKALVEHVERFRAKMGRMDQGFHFPHH